MAKYIIKLPCGMRTVSLNHRVHWSVRNRNGKAIKDAVTVLARHYHIPQLAAVDITVTYRPPDARRRDNDNIPVGSGKYAIDGLVVAGVLADDKPPIVRSVTGRIGDPVNRGQLILEVTECQTATA